MKYQFIAEHAGFARVKTLRLQESKDLVNRGDVSLHDVFWGASPDYAVVAQKHATDAVLALTSYPFSLDYGVSLENLLSRWDGRFDRLEAKAQQAEAKAQQAEAKAQQAEAKAQQAEVASNERLAQLQAVYASSSWKITRPLRGIKRVLFGGLAAMGRSTTAVTLKAKRIFRPVLSSSIKFVFNHSVLRKLFSAALKFIPGLHRRLLRVAVNTGVLKSGHLPGLENLHGQRDLPLELNVLTLHARQIYQDLQAAIENKNKGVA
jgi:O-antigen chain-terminating methyltransferase